MRYPLFLLPYLYIHMQCLWLLLSLECQCCYPAVLTVLQQANLCHYLAVLAVMLLQRPRNYPVMLTVTLGLAGLHNCPMVPAALALKLLAVLWLARRNGDLGHSAVSSVAARPIGLRVALRETSFSSAKSKLSLSTFILINN